MQSFHTEPNPLPESIESLTPEELDDLNYPSQTPPEVSYSGQDFDAEGLVRRLSRGDIVIPNFGDTDRDIETAGFQRSFVWKRPQMDRFIESLLLGYPVPGIFLVRQGDNRLLVLDGQQRLRTLHYFYSGIYGERTYKLQYVANSFKNLSYKDLPPDMRRSLDNTFIQATIVSATPDASNMDAIYQIFERLNSGGTQLTAHEIRVALYAGPIIEFLESINRDGNWRALYGPKNARIRDQELIARIIALFLRSHEYARPLKTFINSFMEENRHSVSEDTIKAGETFQDAAKLINDNIGPSALRRASNQVNNAWTDALFVGIMRRLATEKPIGDTEFLGIYDSLKTNEELQWASTGPSSDEDRVQKRLEITTAAFGA